MSGKSRTTDKDRVALGFVAEYRVVTVAQLAVLLDVTRRTAEWRLERLVTRGQLTLDTPDETRTLEARLADPLGRLRISSRGIEAIETPLKASALPSTSRGESGRARGAPPSSDRHRIGLGWLALGARAGRFGELSAIVSETTMRSADGHVAHSDTPLLTPPGFEAPASGLYEPYGVGEGAANPAELGERHYPDLLLRTTDGRSIAVELELSSKGADSLDLVMRAYACDGRIDAVVYFIGDERLRRPIVDAATRAGVADRLQIRRIGRIEGAPEPGERASAFHHDRTATRPIATHRGHRRTEASHGVER